MQGEPIPSTAAPLRRSAAAARMRLHRERNRLGFRCVSVQLRVTQIRELVRRGLLPGDAQNDPYAIVKALHNYLDRTLKPY